MPNSPRKVLVVEDEIIIADSIVKSLNSAGYISFEPALNYSQAIESMEKELPDIAIIDIQLSGVKDGVDLAEIINSQYRIPFIFLTSNSDQNTLERAKQTKPSAYLLKPFTKQDIYTSLEIALYNFDQKKEQITEPTVYEPYLLVKKGTSYHKIVFDDIVFLKSEHVYLEIVTRQNQKYVVRTSLTDYLKKLPSNFARVHRSYVVNIRFIEKINSNEIVLPEYSIPLSKDYRKELLKNFG